MLQNKGEYIVYRRNKYYVKNNILHLSKQGITHIAEIEGLSKLTGLKALDLSYNNISEINGLETLVELEEVWLNNNKIEEGLIKSLDFLGGLNKYVHKNDKVMLKPNINGTEGITNQSG